MKKQRFNVIAACLALGFAVLSFIALAFKFVFAAGVGKATQSRSWDLGDWNKRLNDGDYIKMIEKTFKCNYGLWQVSRVLMFIVLAVIAVVGVLAFVQLFVNNKALALTTKITGIVSIVLTAVFFVCFLIGGGLASYPTVSGNGVSFFPHVGPILLTLFGILSASFALVTIKKRK